MSQTTEKDKFEVTATQEEVKDSQSPMFTPEPIPETPMPPVQETKRDSPQPLTPPVDSALTFQEEPAETATVHPPSNHMVTRMMNTRSAKPVEVTIAD